MKTKTIAIISAIPLVFLLYMLIINAITSLLSMPSDMAVLAGVALGAALIFATAFLINFIYNKLTKQ